MSSASLIKTPPEKVTVNGWVFYTSTALILLLTAILIIAPQEAGRLLGIAQAWLSRSFGWYYMVVIAACPQLSAPSTSSSPAACADPELVAFTL